MFWSFLSVLIVHIGESIITLGFVIYRSKELQFGAAIAEIKEQLTEEMLPITYSGLVIIAYVYEILHHQDECEDFQMTSDGEPYSHCFPKESSVVLGLASILGWFHLLKYLKGTQIGGSL